jgi:hypothetical protein
MDKPVNLADRPIAFLAIVLPVLTGLFQVLHGFADPYNRWIAWGFSAILFGLSGYLHRVRRSAIVGSNSEPVNRLNPWSDVAYVLAVLMLLILGVDVWYTLSRPPAYVSPSNGVESALEPKASIAADSFRVSAHEDGFAGEGFTSAAKQNVLVRENIRSIGFVMSAENAAEYPFVGETIRALIQKNEDVGVLTVHSIAARVVRFEEMPPCRYMKPVGAMADTVEVSFTLANRRHEPLPWILEPQAVSLNRGEIHGSDRAFPYLVEDSFPTKISCFFVAVDPGIYWIEPIARVSDGVSTSHELSLSKQPLPIAFIGAKSPGGFPDESEAIDILSGKNKEWIPWPPISDSERRVRLESHRKWLDEERSKPL